MTKKTLTAARIFAFATAIFSIALTTLRTSMLQNAYDIENGFYTDAAMHSVIRYSLIALVAIIFATAYIYIKEEKCSALPAEGVLAKGASVLSGCALCGFVIYTFAKAVIPALGGIGGTDLAITVLSAIAMLYFFTIGKEASFRALLCISNALVLLAIVLDLYFDRMVSYVNHSVIICFAAAIFLALAFTAEANFALKNAAYRRYLAYAPSAIVLSFTTAIPDIIYFAANRTAVLTDIYYDIIILVFGLYHLARLIEIALKKEEI